MTLSTTDRRCRLCRAAVPPELAETYAPELTADDWLKLCHVHVLALESWTALELARERSRRLPPSVEGDQLRLC